MAVLLEVPTYYISQLFRAAIATHSARIAILTKGLCFLVFHAKCVDEWLMKWNRSCPICKREIHPERIRNLEQPVSVESDSGTTASALTAITDNSVTSDNDVTESVPLLVTLHEPSDSQTNRYGSVAENNVEGFGDQYLLEPAVHTTELNHQLTSSSESNDGPSDTESYHSAVA